MLSTRGSFRPPGARTGGTADGATYFSLDGVRWERRPNRNAPLTAAFGAGVSAGAAWKGRLLRSTDAVTRQEVLRAPRHVEAVAFGAVGGAAR